jgi:DNA-binding NarL/FixJ family response regulator
LKRPLSSREKQVLALIAVAMTDKEIAVELNLALNTVRGYAKAIYRKLAVHNRAACVIWALTEQHETNTGTEKAD